MNRAEADRLARAIAVAWPVKDGTWPEEAITQWRYDLSELDEGAAGTAFVRLRRSWMPKSGQRHPSLAEFLTVYRQVDLRAPRDRPPCDVCDTTGWAPTTSVERGVTYSCVEPCTCPNGRSRDETFAEVNRKNAEART